MSDCGFVTEKYVCRRMVKFWQPPFIRLFILVSLFYFYWFSLFVCMLSVNV